MIDISKVRLKKRGGQVLKSTLLPLLFTCHLCNATRETFKIRAEQEEEDLTRAERTALLAGGMGEEHWPGNDTRARFQDTGRKS